MRTLLSALAIALAASACGQAQDKPQSGGMPILSAANTIEACYMDHEPDARREQCVGAYATACMDLNSEGSTTIGMIECLAEERDAWDVRLNARYAELQPLLHNDRGREALRDAQRAWIAYRDAECLFSSSRVAGGSIYNYIHTQCLNRITKSRVADFESYLNCQEDDLNCPVP